MSNRKTLDIDPAVSALLAKIEKLKIDNQLKLGEIVTETGIHKEVDADELRDILVRERDRILAAKAHSQEQGHGKANGTFPEKPATSRKTNGHADPEPGRARGPDLLGGAAAE